MIVYLHAVYPGHSAKKVLDAFMSPDIPKRPADVKELGSVTYSDRDGFHGVFLFEVEDSKLAALLNAQGERNVFLGSRAEGVKLEVQVGLSIAEGVPMALKQLPK